jgi:hypothetical protein
MGCPNLGNEGEASITCYFNMLLSGVGAALLHPLRLDDFLFITASVGTMGILGIGLAVHAYMTQAPSIKVNSVTALALLLALISAGRYPIWLVESPPVVHVVPLSIAVWFWTKRSDTDPRAIIIALGTAVIGSVLSKVVSLVTLGATALAGVLPKTRNVASVTKIVVGILVGLSCIYALWMMEERLSLWLSVSSVRPESLEWLLVYQTPIAVAWPLVARLGYVVA